MLVTRGSRRSVGDWSTSKAARGSAEEGEAAVTFDAGGERRFKFSEIARIYTGQYPQQTSSSSSSTADVPAECDSGGSRPAVDPDEHRRP
ncbi:MAG: hypothetical protein R2712_18210 [Vicinamibacterales bacterium]